MRMGFGGLFVSNERAQNGFLVPVILQSKDGYDIISGHRLYILGL